MSESKNESLPFVRDLSSPPHPSWEALLAHGDTAKALEYAWSAVEHCPSVTPVADRVLRMLHTDLQAMKVVILGQDPYPQAGAATGRSFEVGTLMSWEDSFRNVSLKNIVRALYAASSGETLGYKQVLGRVAQGWPLLSPQILFGDWEAQGVLLLNTAFTCQVGAAGSHTEHWQPFTALLLRYICDANPQIVWFVWGKHAERHTANLPIAHKMVSQHPMMCYEGTGRKDDFLFGDLNMFRQTANLITWNGSDNAIARQPKQGLFY